MKFYNNLFKGFSPFGQSQFHAFLEMPLSNLDELAKSRQYAFFIQNHEEHEVHEAEIIIYFFIPS
jgi:hypothetical protein